MDWTAVVTQELAMRAGVAPGPLRVARNAVGTMRVRNVSDPTDEVVHDWHITYDADNFTMVSNKTIVVSPGIYDFLFDVTIDNHQYVGEAAAVLIEDGADTLVPMTVAAVIGDTDVIVEIVGVLPELRFSYPASELASLTAPAIGISIDGGAEQTLALDVTNGMSSQYVGLTEGAHTIELKLYDGAVQIGKSIAAQESQTIVAGQDVTMDLVPLSGQATVTFDVTGGDATFDFTIPNEIVDEAGGAGNLQVLFKLASVNNNPADVSLILTDNGDGTSSASHTHTGMRPEDVTLALEFHDTGSAPSELLASCTMSNVVLDVNGSMPVCQISLRRRARIQGNVLATVGINVFDTDGNPRAGATVSADGTVLGLTNSGAFGTPGYLRVHLREGSYTLRATLGSEFGEEDLTVTPLAVTNVDITMQMALASCKQIRDAGLDVGDGVYTLDADGAGLDVPYDAYCDMTTEGGAWLDLVQTMNLPGADVAALIDRFLVSNGVQGTTISGAAASGAVTGADGFYVVNTPYSGHNGGFHLQPVDMTYSRVRLDYRMQGSQDDYNGCSNAAWVPLNGPGYDGGHNGYLSPCLPGHTCIQGRPTNYRDAPISASYASDTIDSQTTLLTWSGSADTTLSDSCARDPEIPTDSPAVFFTRLLLE